MIKRFFFLVLILSLIAGCSPAKEFVVSNTITDDSENVGRIETPDSSEVNNKTLTQTPDQEQPALVPVNQAPQIGGKLVRAITSEPTTLDPHGAAGSGQNVILPYLLDTLIYRDIDNSYKPYLANEWIISSDGKIITFMLKQGITFHDGTPLNAEAVKFTYDRVLVEGSRSPLVSSFANIDKIEAVGDDQVIFTLKQPSSTLFSALSTAYAGIISPTAVQKYGDQFGLNPVGSGAFQLESWKSGETITLTSNQSYTWGPSILENKGAPYLTSLIFKVIPDASSQITAFNANEVDIFFVNQPSQFDALSKNTTVHLLETNLNSLVYLGFNV